jgi:hypothetical protein
MERATGTHWIGGWVGLRAGLDSVEKRKFLTLPGLELRSQSLYRPRYPRLIKLFVSIGFLRHVLSFTLQRF